MGLERERLRGDTRAGITPPLPNSKLKRTNPRPTTGGGTARLNLEQRQGLDTARTAGLPGVNARMRAPRCNGFVRMSVHLKKS